MAQAADTEALERLPAGDRPKRRLPFYVEVFVRLVREKPMGLFGLICVVMFIVLAIFSPYIAPHSPNELGNAQDRLTGPSLSYPFGTDNLARDVLSRVMIGSRTAITVGFLSVLIATVLAMGTGLISGYFGGWTDMLLQRLVDAVQAFPGIVFLIGVGSIFIDYKIPGLPARGLFSTPNVVLICSLGFLFGLGQSRVVRSAVLSVTAQTYIEAARAVGVGNGRMILVHVMPNVMAPVITIATLSIGNAILAAATLSFLGLGVSPDVPDWGQMLNTEARSFMTRAWWLAVFPGAALSLAVFSFNMLGDALRDLLDPRLRTG